MPLVAVLQSASPLGDFHKTIGPGNKVCCDWFDRGCNPGGRQGSLVALSIGSLDRKKKAVPGVAAPYTPIQTYDRYGNPDPNGHYDHLGIYDEHGYKPYYEPVPTFDKYGNPDPHGHYDRHGVYDPNGHRGRRGRLVIPQNNLAPPLPDTSESNKSHYCSRGRTRTVTASGDGTVTVTEHALSPGGLRCESRDHFLRPVNPASQASEFGVPLPGLPPLIRKPAELP